MKVTLGIGSNSGDRSENVSRALEWLSSRTTGFRCSRIYETPPYGHKGSNYMNAVATGEIIVSLSEFEKECKEYEVSRGRDAESRSRGEVPVDLDVVIVDGGVLRPCDFKREFFQIGYRELMARKAEMRASMSACKVQLGICFDEPSHDNTDNTDNTDNVDR